MFVLRVHSVDSGQPLELDEASFFSRPRREYRERRGVVHLYRTVLNPSSLSTSLFVVAVPNYISPSDLLRFFDDSDLRLLLLLIIRNEAMEDRYSALVEFDDQAKADSFYRFLNGRRFSPREAELCHILYVGNVEYTDLEEIASVAPDGYTELPTCPICLERLDRDTGGVLRTLCDHSFPCACTSNWTYLSCQVCRFCQQRDEKPACSACGTQENLWVCLICGFAGCGRYKEGHAIRHWKETKHSYCIDLKSQQIWDYVGDNYVHRLNQSKLVDMNSPCASLEDECGTCRAIFRSKVEAMVDEYNHRLATQLDTQRQHYESLIRRAESELESIVSEEVEKAKNEILLLYGRKPEKYEKQKKKIIGINRHCVKELKILEKVCKEIEERESSSLKEKDETIKYLEEQIRDLTVSNQAQSTLGTMSLSDDEIRERTVLPDPAEQCSTSRKWHAEPRRKRN